MTFLNAAILFGLVSVALPVVVHLLHRKRYEVVEWAATQFLPELRTSARNKLEFDHIGLMILRMIVIALIVLAFASPRLSSRLSRITESSSPRDVVIIIDGSASMSRSHDGITLHNKAIAWVRNFAQTMESGDRIAVYSTRQARKSRPTLASERSQIEPMIDALPAPSGIPDWNSALVIASELFGEEDRKREIVLLTDGQKIGWSDDSTLQSWELATQIPGLKDVPISAIALPTSSMRSLSNAWLEPIRVDRPVATSGRDIEFRTRVHWVNRSPESIVVHVLANGKLLQSIPLTATNEPGMEITIQQKFDPGSYCMTFQLNADDFESDNRQDFAIDVLARIPVLIVVGQSPNRVGFFRQALAPVRDSSPAFVVREVSHSSWTTRLIEEDIDGQGTPPKILVLDNIDKLAPEQIRQVEQFLQQGGSVFVLPGPQCDPTLWNRFAYRNGQGFFPLRFQEIARVENLKPRMESFTHPSVSIFRTPLHGGLQTATFGQYWKWLPVDQDAKSATVVAEFANRDPMLVESSFGKGKVLVSSVPFEDYWKTNLFRLPDFVRLCHELCYSLMGTAMSDNNQTVGQIVFYTPTPSELPGAIRITGPDGQSVIQTASQWPLTLDLAEPGGYRITSPAGRVKYYAIRPDLRESDLAPAMPDELNTVSGIMKTLVYRKENELIPRSVNMSRVAPELWWLALLGVLVLLLMELRYARKLTQRGDHHLKA